MTFRAKGSIFTTWHAQSEARPGERWKSIASIGSGLNGFKSMTTGIGHWIGQSGLFTQPSRLIPLQGHCVPAQSARPSQALSALPQSPFERLCPSLGRQAPSPKPAPQLGLNSAPSATPQWIQAVSRRKTSSPNGLSAVSGASRLPIRRPWKSLKMNNLQTRSREPALRARRRPRCRQALILQQVSFLLPI